MAEAKKTGHHQIAEEVIKSLKEGTAPWLKPWNPGDSQPPVNPVSGTEYSGINRMMLSLNDYADPRWMTFNQANKQELLIKKGSKSQKIEYWMWETRVPSKDENGLEILGENGKPEMVTVKLSRPTVRYYSVFHASQLQTKDGNDLPPLTPKALEWNSNEMAEAILNNSRANIKHDQRDRACYRIKNDEIHMPPRENFPTSGMYYGTALHELAHWTRHSSRLSRDNGPFGSPVYAKEELRAEIASLMICQELGLPFDPGQHVSYVDSWVKALEDDPNEIVRACRDAEKIKEYIMGLELKRDQELEQPVENEIVMEPEVSKEKVYLNVLFKEKEEVKALGATWDNGKKLWCARPGVDLQKFSKWIAPEQEIEKVATVEPGPELLGEKTFLQVPYTEKNAAKNLGAQWDKQAKLWFAPVGADIAPLAKWIPEVTPTPAVTMSPEDEFSQALQSAGLKLDGPPVLDGKIHRVPVEGGKQGARDGAYSAHSDGRPNGWIQNHKTGHKEKWVATGQVLTDDQKMAMRTEAAEKLARREVERQADQKMAIAKIQLQFSNADKDLTKLPINYLEKKGVYSDELLSQNLGDYISDIRCEDGKIMIGGHDKDGNLRTVQTISADGEKHFAQGCPKAGAMHIIAPYVDEKQLREYLYSYNGPIPTIFRPTKLQEIAGAGNNEILLAEGYATGASLFLATKKAVVVAFDSGNLKAVAQAIRDVHPNVKITVCADNDHLAKLKSNVGLEKATEAALAVGGSVVLPEFTQMEMATGLTDFNDLHQSRGLEAVKDAFKTKEMAISNAQRQFDAAGVKFSGLAANYLEGKGILSDDILGQNSGDYLSNVRCEDDKIMIPGLDKDGNLQTIQTISADGEKHFAKGCPYSGAMHIIAPDSNIRVAEDWSTTKDPVVWPQEVRKINDVNAEILVCKDYETGASLHLATKLPVVVAFDSGNFKAVALAIRESNPMTNLTICAENVDFEKAKEAALAAEGNVVLPKFTEKETAAGLSDFNDLHQSRGLQVVAENLKSRYIEFIPNKQQVVNFHAQHQGGMSR